MVTLEIDWQQVRQDVKVWAYYVGGILSFVLMVGLIAEIWQVIDILPFWVDALIIAIYLMFVGLVAYNRYTVEENAGGSETQS